MDKDNTKRGIYTDMIHNLDEMAFTFAQEFNKLHQDGWSLTELTEGVKSDKTFFDVSSSADGAAKSIKLHKNILDSVDNIAAAEEI